MTTDRFDLDWIAEQRPEPSVPDASTAARARARLLAHIEGGTVRMPPSRPRPRRRWALRFAGGVALAGAAASVALLTVSSSGGSGSGTATVGHVLGVQSAAAAQLQHLSHSLLDSPLPGGDATLVIRKQTYPDRSEYDGADLYLDNGDYYFSEQKSGLPQLVAAHETENDGATDAEYRDIAAAKAAFDGSIDAARQRMSIANFDPGVKPGKVYPQEQRFVREKLAAAHKALVKDGKTGADYTPLTPTQHEDSMIWTNSMDALLAGAGDPKVRAGVLHLLATIPEVTVSQDTLDGVRTLTLTNSLFPTPSGYREALTVDASSGIPIVFHGGVAGQTPSVTVTYTISRVTASSLN